MITRGRFDAAGYREVRPIGVLGEHVAAVWVRSARDPHTGSETAVDYREIPDGGLNLVCRTGQPLQIVGPLTAPRPGRLAAGEVMVGLRLRPGAATAIGMPAGELADRTVDAADLLGHTDDDRLAAADPITALGLMADLVLTSAEDTRPDPMITEAIRRLANEPDIATVWREMGLSERSFRRRFGVGVGVGPKTLQTLLRFQRLLRRAQRAVAAGRPIAEHGLAALAGDLGYADQPHLSRECLRITGSTLGSYLRELQGCGDHDHRAQLAG